MKTFDLISQTGGVKGFAYPIPSPKRVIVVVHGLGEHAGRYAGFIGEMNRAGLSAYTVDLPGHGVNKGKRGFGTVSEMVAVIEQVVSRAQKECPGVSLGLFGHSLGGLVAIRTIQKQPALFSRAAISAPLLGLPADQEKRIKTMAWLAKLLPALTVKNGLAPELLSRDRSIVDAYTHDPLVHDKVSLALGYSIYLEIQQAFSESDKVKLPALFLTGSADRIVVPQAANSFFERVPSPDKAFRTYEGAYHETFYDPEHGERFRTDIIDWLSKT